MLGCAVADELYARFPRAAEGELTRLRARLVRQEALAEVAQGLGLAGRVRSTLPARDSILADAVEAVLGAVFLDGGYDAARRAAVKAFGPLLADIEPGNADKDAKTRLQELMHARGEPLPAYRVLATSGAAHEPSFEVECAVAGLSARGTGNSRRRAEQEAARAMLAKLPE